MYIFGESFTSLWRKTQAWTFAWFSLCVLDKMLRTLACLYLWFNGVSEDVTCLSCVLSDVTRWRSVTLLLSDTFRLHTLPHLIHTTRSCSTKCCNHRMLLVVLWWIIFEQSIDAKEVNGMITAKKKNRWEGLIEGPKACSLFTMCMHSAYTFSHFYHPI